jgi:hypothetical protein
VEANPNGLFVADWNGDGLSDLIIPGGRQGDGGSWVHLATFLLGEEGGRFQQGGFMTQRQIVATADFEGDRRADLAVITPAWRVQILLNKAEEAFEPADELEYFGSAIVADFNRDGVPDLAGTTSMSEVVIFLGKGGGRFQPAARYTQGNQMMPGPSTLLAADFDGNGNSDLAFQKETSICILLGAADGSFTSGPCTTTAKLPMCANCIFAAADFDGDGKTDLAMAETPWAQPGGPPEPLRSILWLFPGLGDGTFAAPVKVYSSPDNARVASLLAADFEGDGRAALAAGLQNSVGARSVAILAPRPVGSSQLSRVQPR